MQTDELLCVLEILATMSISSNVADAALQDRQHLQVLPCPFINLLYASQLSVASNANIPSVHTSLARISIQDTCGNLFGVNLLRTQSLCHRAKHQ